jgi:hypothetical protein
LAFALAVGLPIATLALPKTSPKPSEQTLAEISARGIELAQYDQAAWHATDAVQASQPAESKVERFIARKTPSGTGWIVDFGRLNSTSDKFLVAYEALQTDAPEHFEVKMFEPEREDSGFDLAAVLAIDLSLKDFGEATRPYNVAVLPAPSEGLFVYVYPAQVKDGIYPYGGDVRYLISADGKTLIVKRQLHKAVLEFNANAATVAGYHVHVLSDLPEDTDVFLVMERHPKVPEYVGAGGRNFIIGIDGKVLIGK